MKLTKHRQQELLYLAKLVTEERKSGVINFAKEKEITDLWDTVINGSYYEYRFYHKIHYLLDNTQKFNKRQRLEVFNAYYGSKTLDYVQPMESIVEPITDREKVVENKQHTKNVLDYFIHSLVVLIIILALLGISQAVKAEEIIYHIGAYHTNDNYHNWEYNNKTTGVGIRWKDATLGTYIGSYPASDEGALNGTIIYVNHSTPIAKQGKLTLASNVAVTYGYPEWLKGNTNGIMLVPSLSATYMGKQYGVAVSMVPGQWVKGDNAYMVSLIAGNKK